MNVLNLKTGEPFDPAPRLHHREQSALAVSSSELSQRARGMLLGAKSFYIGGEMKYTAKDYASYDKMAFHWDAIENAGYGVHDGNSNSFVELSGSGYNPKSDIFSWDDYYLNELSKVVLFNYRAHPLTVERLSGKSMTYEIVFSFNDFDGSACPVGISMGSTSGSESCIKASRWTVGGQTCRIGGRMKTWDGSLGVSYADAEKYYQSKEMIDVVLTIDANDDGSASKESLWINGEKVMENPSAPGVNYSNSWYMMFQSSHQKFGNYLVYGDKVLTSDEIKYNYKVNKARFRLP